MDLELCERALALIREADALLEQVGEEPRGWSPWETRGYLADAISMLEPLPEDSEPPRLRSVGGNEAGP